MLNIGDRNIKLIRSLVLTPKLSLESKTVNAHRTLNRNATVGTEKINAQFIGAPHTHFDLIENLTLTELLITNGNNHYFCICCKHIKRPTSRYTFRVRHFHQLGTTFIKYQKLVILEKSSHVCS